MLILGNSNNLYENTYPPTTADALKAFGAYCYDIAHKTKDTVFYFEVWNEFNLAKETKGFTPETYANILKVAYENVKAANPKAKVFLGGLGRVYGNEGHLDEDYVWLNSLFDKIAANDVKFDGVTIHPYRFLSPEEGEFVEQIQDFKNYLTAKGYGDKMLWISEMGWPSFNDPSWMQITEKQQAEYLVRMLALNEANSLAERVIWYCDRDYGINPVDQEQNFGLIKATAYETPYAAKPSYVAMAQYNKFFGTAENVSRRIVGQNVSVVSGYNPNGERVSVIWKAEGKETVTLTMPANSTLSVFDIYGNQLPVTVEDLSYTIEVSESPIYVKNTFEMLYYEVNGSQVCVSATIDKERFSSATLCVVTYNKATGVMTSVKCSDKFVLADGLYTANVSVEPETDEVVKAILLESVESLASLTTHLYID